MKIVKDDFLFQVERVDGEMKYSAHYEVESEGISQKRGTEIELSSAQKTQINNFLRNVVFPKVQEREV